MLRKINELFPPNSHSSLKSASSTASKTIKLLEKFVKENFDEPAIEYQILIKIRKELPKSEQEIRLLSPDKIKELSRSLDYIFKEDLIENDDFLERLKKFLPPQEQPEPDMLRKLHESLLKKLSTKTDSPEPIQYRILKKLSTQLPESEQEIRLLSSDKKEELLRSLDYIFNEDRVENDIFLKNLKKCLNNGTAIAMFVPTPQKESESKILQTLEESLLNLQGEKTNNQRVRALIEVSHYQIFDNEQIKQRAPNICQIMKLARKKAGKKDGIATIEKELEKIYEKQDMITAELTNFSMIIYSSSFSDGVRPDGRGCRLFYWEQPKGEGGLPRSKSAHF